MMYYTPFNLHRWVNQCYGEIGIPHELSGNRRTLEFSYVGQNKATKWHQTRLAAKFLSQMIEDMYDEVHICLKGDMPGPQQYYFITLLEEGNWLKTGT